MSEKPNHVSLLMASLESLVILLLTLSSADSKTFFGDVTAFKDLKNSVDTKSITPGSCLSTWDFSIDPCDNLFSDTFTCGFRCKSGRVTELSLDQAGYSGSLSSVSFNFPYLQILDLTGNYFSGSLPKLKLLDLKSEPEIHETTVTQFAVCLFLHGEQPDPKTL